MPDLLSNILLIIAVIIIGIPMGLFMVGVMILALVKAFIGIVSDTGKAITVPAILAGGFALLKDKLDLDRDRQKFERKLFDRNNKRAGD